MTTTLLYLLLQMSIVMGGNDAQTQENSNTLSAQPATSASTFDGGGDWDDGN